MQIKRRKFLKSLAVIAAGLHLNLHGLAVNSQDRLGRVLPLRRLGKTGKNVTCLGLGGFHIGWIEKDETAQAVIEAALEEGVRFFDTAEGYGNGRSEERFGRFLTPKYREEIFLMTKTGARDVATAREHLDGSLRRMKTDTIDLWQLHALSSPEDSAFRLEAGLLDFALEAKASGKVRHIGFTGHSSPYAHTRMLTDPKARDGFETCLLPINPVDAGASHSFIEEVLPGLTEADYGVLAMKTLADGRFFERKTMNGRVQWETERPVVPDVLTIEECIHFALSLPIAVLVTGAETPALVREKAAMVRQFEAFDEDARLAVVEKVASFAEAGEIEYYKNQDIRG